jgi:hypothetical protein
MKYLETYENKKLIDDFLNTIHYYIKNKNYNPSVLTIAGALRFKFKEKYPKKYIEYLYRVSDGEDLIEVIKSMTNDIDDEEIKTMLEYIK